MSGGAPELVPPGLLADLRTLAEEQEKPGWDEAGRGCEAAWALMTEAGVPGWVIPERFGGSERPAAEVMAGYEMLAAANLCATFVLTQFNAAAARVAGCDNEELKARTLPKLADGSLTATVGISHLTTSRRHTGRPMVLAEPLSGNGGHRLTGTLPWCTNAGFAGAILVGAERPDGTQLLAMIPGVDDPAVMDCAAPELLALSASRTAEVTLGGVVVPDRDLVAGPAEEVMKQGAGGTGSVGTSALAVGHAAGSLRGLAGEADKRPELRETLEPLEAERARLSADLQTVAAAASAADLPDGLSAQSVRARANSLCLRSAQSYLTASKGAGFVAGHPAGRFVREAMFFQVWSCPAPVAAAALREFACGL